MKKDAITARVPDAGIVPELNATFRDRLSRIVEQRRTPMDRVCASMESENGVLMLAAENAARSARDAMDSMVAAGLVSGRGEKDC